MPEGFMEEGGMVHIPINDAEERVNVPEGRYDLTIKSVKVHETEKGKSLMVGLTIEGYDQPTNTVFHFVPIPRKDEDDDKRNSKLLMAKAFFTEFEIEVDEDGNVALSDFPGKTGRGKLTIEQYEGRDSNKLQLDW